MATSRGYVPDFFSEPFKLNLLKSNIVVDASGTIAKICDFGSSVINCSCDGGPKDRKGTVLWDSPELAEEDDSIRTFQSDVWAFGCVMLEVSPR